ncbi:helix-turn-helix transcriptional regulator [Photobacterium chitinilyticum]|nr:AraC family transcriptional regulator [Photobacterium chitinilyticum]
MDYSLSIEMAISELVGQACPFDQVLFGGNQPVPPELAYQVDFPRIELVLEGRLPMQIATQDGVCTDIELMPGKVLYLPDFCWNKPTFTGPVTTLSLLFGRESLGFSLLHWNGEAFEAPLKRHIPRRGPRTGTFILRALEELCWHQEEQQTAQLLIHSLLSNSQELLTHPPETPSKGHAIFEAIRDYIDHHYQESITRESVAKEFYICPNYLSQLFYSKGGVKFQDYLIKARLEKAKYLLKKYDMKVKEVAHNCGFKDSNYFCRAFRKNTNRSPSEYRVHYRSKLS